MTDPTLPPDDEIVSAVLDGEATADERARVAADPALAARRAQFEEVRHQIATPVAVPAAARERAVAAALAELDRSAGSGSSPRAATPVAPAAPAGSDELAARRARRARAGPILAAAAAVVLVLVGLGAVLTASRGTNDVLTSSAPQAANAPTTTAATGGAADSSDAATEEPAVEDQVVTTTSVASSVPANGSPAPASNQPEAAFAAVPPVALGTVTTPGQLRSAMVSAIDQRPAPTTTVPPPTTAGVGDPRASAGIGAFTTCGSYLLAVDPEIGTVLATATATFQNRPVMVYAFAIDRSRFPAANGTLRIYALDTADCSTVSVQTTDP